MKGPYRSNPPSHYRIIEGCRSRVFGKFVHYALLHDVTNMSLVPALHQPAKHLPGVGRTELDAGHASGRAFPAPHIALSGMPPARLTLKSVTHLATA